MTDSILSTPVAFAAPTGVPPAQTLEPLEITTVQGFPCWRSGASRWVLLPFDMLLLEFPAVFSDQEIEAFLAEGKLLNRYPFHTNPRPILDGILLYITRRCNMHCRYCEVRIPGKNPDMDLGVLNAAFEFIAYAAKKNGNSLSIVFFGGEPSLRTDSVTALLERFKRAGVTVKSSICTNGRIPKTDLDRLLRHSMDWRVSLDVPGEWYGDLDHRRGIDYETVHETIRTIAGHGGPLSINATVTRATLPLMPQMVDKCRELGCGRIRFIPMKSAYHRSADVPELTPDPAEYVEMLYRCRDRGGDDVDVMESHLGMMFGARRAKCPSTSITPDGVVLPTVSEGHLQERLHLGNVMDRDFETIFAKSAMFRRQYFRDVDEVCEGCIARRVCSGGNMAIEIMLGSKIVRNDCLIMRKFMQTTCERLFAFSRRTPLPEYSGDSPARAYRYHPF